MGAIESNNKVRHKFHYLATVTYKADLFVEPNRLYVVKYVEQMGLDSVGVTGLSEDLKQGGVGHEEEPREEKSLLLQIAKREVASLKREIASGFFFFMFLLLKLIFAFCLIRIFANALAKYHELK